jgi:hypothetical protein
VLNLAKFQPYSHKLMPSGGWSQTLDLEINSQVSYHCA